MERRLRLCSRSVHSRLLPSTILTIAAVALAPARAEAALLTVDDVGDQSDVAPGDGVCATEAARCTLRAALDESNALPGPDEVALPAGTYAVTTPLSIQDSLTVRGDSVTTTFVDGSGVTNLLWIRPPEGMPGLVAQLSGLTLQNGYAGATYSGAGLLVYEGAEVSCTECRIRDHRSSVFGGGIRNEGVLRLHKVEVTGNALPRGQGGVTSTGGGIYNGTRATLRLEQSLVQGNEATRGGGIGNQGRLDVVSSTISGNRAGMAGGGLRNVGSGYARIAASTITENQANLDLVFGGEPNVGGGLFNLAPALVEIGGSIVAGNTDGRSFRQSDYAPDCHSSAPESVGSFGGNVLGVLNGHCGLVDATGWASTSDRTGTTEVRLEPGLGPLAASGASFVRAHALAPESVAIDAAPADGPRTFFSCPATDQRGGPRPLDGDGDGEARCDAGAIEAEAVPPEKPPTPPTITGFVLVDAETDRDVRTLRDGEVLSRSRLPRSWTIRAVTGEGVASVRFTVDGRARIDDGAPFSLGGDRAGDLAGASLRFGVHVLSAQPFRGLGAGGEAGALARLRLTVLF